MFKRLIEVEAVDWLFPYGHGVTMEEVAKGYGIRGDSTDEELERIAEAAAYEAMDEGYVVRLSDLMEHFRDIRGELKGE
jgi:hypothetical protein